MGLGQYHHGRAGHWAFENMNQKRLLSGKRFLIYESLRLLIMGEQ
jgi:hypothetical protein